MESGKAKAWGRVKNVGRGRASMGALSHEPSTLAPCAHTRVIGNRLPASSVVDDPQQGLTLRILPQRKGGVPPNVHLQPLIKGPSRRANAGCYARSHDMTKGGAGLHRHPMASARALHLSSVKEGSPMEVKNWTWAPLNKKGITLWPCK